MTDLKQHMLLCLKKAAVLFLYVSLFMVHLLSNFFVSNEANNGQRPLQFGKAGIGKAASYTHLKQAGKATNQKPGMRLNKRFQPESGIIPINTYTLPVPVERYTDVARIGHPTTYLLFSVILAQSMRGPPVLA